VPFKYIIADTCSVRKLSHLGDFLDSQHFKSEYDLVTNDEPLEILTKIAKTSIYDDGEESLNTFKAEVIIIDLHGKGLLTDKQVKDFLSACNTIGPYTAKEFNYFFDRFEQSP
jgi:hypothetical protein